MPKVDEVIYYTIFLMNWVFELLVSLVAVMAFLLVPFCAAMYLHSRKPATLRAIITLVSLKVVWVIFHVFQIHELDQPAFTCDIYGTPKPNPGPSDAGMQISGLFTSHLMQAIVLNNMALTHNDTALLRAQMATGIFAYLVYQVKLYQCEASQQQILSSMEVGIIITIFCKIATDLLGLWPLELLSIEEETLDEQIILQSLCSKCGIDNKLPKLERLDKI